MTTPWSPRFHTNRTGTPRRARALLVVATFLMTGLVLPTVLAQGGGAGGAEAPEAPPEPSNATLLPDLTLVAFVQVYPAGPCCDEPRPDEPTPPCCPAPEEEPCCAPEPAEPSPPCCEEPESPESPEPSEPTPPCCEEPEPAPPCCEAPPDCCPHDPPSVLYLAAFDVVVANYGNATAHDVRTSIQGPQAQVHDVAPIEVLAPGERRVIRVHITAEAGVHELQAVVDPDDVIVEATEANNGATITARFGPEPRADLYASSLWFETTELGRGEFLDAHLRLANGGDADAYGFRVVTFMDGHILDAFTHPGLLVGEESSHRIHLGTPARDTTIAIVIDAYDEVEERNEWNNQLHAYHAVARADLRASGLHAPDVALSGDPEAPEATVRFQVENHGDRAAHQTDYELLLDGELVATRTLPEMAPHSTLDVETTVPAKPGTYLLQLRLDSRNHVDERNEVDNLDAAIAVFGHPDLTVEMDASVPEDGQYGDTGSARVIVRNDGRFMTNGSMLVVRDGAVALARIPVAPLAPGAEASFEAAWTMSPGVHTLRAEVDVDGVVLESDETNNHDELVMDLGLPELAVTTVGWDLDTPEEGRPLHVMVNVSYAGRLALPGTAIQLEIDGAVYDAWQTSRLSAGDALSMMSEWHPNRGDHELTARIDPAGAWSESNETNNVWHGSVHVRPPTPAVCTTAPDVQETCRRVLLGEEDPLVLEG